MLEEVVRIPIPYQSRAIAVLLHNRGGAHRSHAGIRPEVAMLRSRADAHAVGCRRRRIEAAAIEDM
jgi:hypothetical protein